MNKIKLSKDKKKSIFNCLLDLEYYYANHGNQKDYEDFEILLKLMRVHKIKTPKYINSSKNRTI